MSPAYSQRLYLKKATIDTIVPTISPTITQNAVCVCSPGKRTFIPKNARGKRLVVYLTVSYNGDTATFTPWRFVVGR